MGRTTTTTRNDTSKRRGRTCHMLRFTEGKDERRHMLRPYSSYASSSPSPSSHSSSSSSPSYVAYDSHRSGAQNLSKP